MSDALNRYIGFGRFAPNPQPLTDAQRRIVDAIPLTERATVNELRTQLAAMTAERDAELAKVVVLRDALQHIDWNLRVNESTGDWYLGYQYNDDTIRDALEKTR